MNEKLEQLLVTFEKHLNQKPSGNKKDWHRTERAIKRQITSEFMNVTDPFYAKDFKSRMDQIEYKDWL